jgi:predicted transcriptional regulator
MGQQEVYTFLKKNKSRWFTSREIAKKLKASLGSVTTCLKKLRDSSSVNFKYPNKSGQGKNSYVYQFRE